MLFWEFIWVFIICNWYGRHRSKRSRSREMDHGRSGSGRRHDYEPHVQEGICKQKQIGDDRKRIKHLDEKLHEESNKFIDNHPNEIRGDENYSGGSSSDRDKDKERERRQGHTRKYARHRSTISEKSTDYRGTKSRSPEADYDGNWSDAEKDAGTHHVHTRKSLRCRSRSEIVNEDGDKEKETLVAGRDSQDRDTNGERDYSQLGKRSRSAVRYLDNEKDEGGDVGSIRDRSDGDISSDRHQNRRKRSLGHQSSGSKYLHEDGVGDYRTYYNDSRDGWLGRDKEIHNSRRRKHSRNRSQESKFSDNQGEPTIKLKKNFHDVESENEKSDAKRDTRHKFPVDLIQGKREAEQIAGVQTQREEITNRVVQVNVMKDVKALTSRIVGKHINVKEDKKSGMRTTCVLATNLASAGQYSGRSKLQGFNLDYHINEKFDGDHWDAKDASEEDEK